MTNPLIKGFPSSAGHEVSFQPNKPIFGKIVKGDVGLELEVEGKRLPSQEDVSTFKSSTLGRVWTVHNDGSLRNGGLEYVLDAPCLEEEVPEMVEGLFKIFDVNKTKLDFNQRTSTHVHINVSHMKANHLTSFLVLWYIFEEALLNWCGETRAGNLFCLRSKDSSFIPEQWRDSLSSGHFKFSNDYKYSSLNLGAFSRFGSFEFRGLRGCEEPSLVIQWSSLLMALRKEAETTLDNPPLIVERMSGEGPDSLFQSLCDKYHLGDFAKEILSLEANQDFNKMCWEGFRNIQSIIYEVDWNKIIDKSRETYIRDPFAKEKPSSAKIRVGTLRGGPPELVRPTTRWAVTAAPIEQVDEDDIDEDDDDLDDIDDAPDEVRVEARRTPPMPPPGGEWIPNHTWAGIPDEWANTHLQGLPPARTFPEGVSFIRTHAGENYVCKVHTRVWYVKPHRNIVPGE